MTNKEADLSMKRAFTSMGDSSENESKDEGFKNQSLLAIGQADKYIFLALIIETDSEDDEEDDKQSNVSLHHNKVKIDSYSKRELESLLSTLIDAYQSISSEREQMMENYASLRKENDNLEKYNLRLQNKLKDRFSDVTADDLYNCEKLRQRRKSAEIKKEKKETNT
ncbi:hypothetical protein H5410_042022 [Solanum commersonii]|uniref:Uncharacterized protein n=1 Tax=Solanum commersonii TaxID=4109 RepID=A0A9J5XWB2_SOLCO|nr:hypothetical protein H5410_042022 [Solanum commersonii]